MTMAIQANRINTLVMTVGSSPHLRVSISGTAVEYLQPVPLSQIAKAAAEAAGYVTGGTPHVELLGSTDRVMVTFPSYT